MFDTKYLGLKVFWLICLLGCVSLCAYLVAQTFLAYLSNPVYTTTTIVHEVPTEFPKFTICNSMYGTSEYAYEMIQNINNELYPNLSVFDKTQMSQLAYDDAFDKSFSVFNIFHTRINNHSFPASERKKFVHSFEDVLFKCKFNGQNCTANDFVWKWDPLIWELLCFQFGL